MSTKAMSTISTSFKFAGEKVSSNIIEYVRRENIEINEFQMKALQNIVESSLQQAFSLTSDSIEKSLNE
tara:strand:+ start:729 stop:935 length:207 start_codon:yes stop_codon:yes gene_type:complete